MDEPFDPVQAGDYMVVEWTDHGLVTSLTPAPSPLSTIDRKKFEDMCRKHVNIVALYRVERIV